MSLSPALTRNRIHPAGFCLRDFFAAAENLWGLFAQAKALAPPDD